MLPEYMLYIGKATWSLRPKFLDVEYPEGNNKDDNLYFAQWAFKDGVLQEVGDTIINEPMMKTITPDPRFRMQAHITVLAEGKKAVTFDGQLIDALTWLFNNLDRTPLEYGLE